MHGRGLQIAVERLQKIQRQEGKEAVGFAYAQMCDKLNLTVSESLVLLERIRESTK